MIFYFQTGVSGQISALMLEPFFLNNIAKLTYKDPDFERFLHIARGYDAIFRIMTVYSIDLQYFTPGTGC